MDLLTTIFVTFFAGMGAGLGTGFAGMSAAAVISPLLIHFLGIDPYMAVGIALSSDVLASAISAYTYGKNKNLDVKNGLIMMVSVLAFTVVGSYVSSLVPSRYTLQPCSTNMEGWVRVNTSGSSWTPADTWMMSTLPSSSLAISTPSSMP